MENILKDYTPTDGDMAQAFEACGGAISQESIIDIPSTNLTFYLWESIQMSDGEFLDTLLKVGGPKITELMQCVINIYTNGVAF